MACTIAILLHVYCAIYEAPPPPLLYTIHHTINIGLTRLEVVHHLAEENDFKFVYIKRVRDRVRSRRARRVYYTTSLECETEIEGGGCA